MKAFFKSKTVLFGAAILVAGLTAIFGVDVEFTETVESLSPIILSVIGVVTLVLRKMTSSPIGLKDE